MIKLVIQVSNSVVAWCYAVIESGCLYKTTVKHMLHHSDWASWTTCSTTRTERLGQCRLNWLSTRRHVSRVDMTCRSTGSWTSHRPATARTCWCILPVTSCDHSGSYPSTFVRQHVSSTQYLTNHRRVLVWITLISPFVATQHKQLQYKTRFLGWLLLSNPLAPYFLVL